MKYILLLFCCALFSCNSDPAGADDGTLSSDPKSVLLEELMKEDKEKKNLPPAENPYKNSKIEVRVFDNKKEGNNVPGFGYDIIVDTATYVHQPHIPAVPGNQGFTTAEKAKKAGEFVAYKIRNNILPPSVTVEELDSLQVLK